MASKKKMAFEFVLERLYRVRPVARPMFGCHAVYVGDRIMLATRQKGSSDGCDGIWVATKSEFHPSLRTEIPSLRSISVLGSGETQWQVIPEDCPTFEEDVMHVCDLILKNDPRIGNIPKARQGKKAIRKR